MNGNILHKKCLEVKMIEINGVKYIVHYRTVWPWGTTSSCGEPVISYLERVDEK